MNRMAFLSQVFRTPWTVMGTALAVATLSGSALAVGPSESVALDNGAAAPNAPTTGASAKKEVPRADLSVTLTASIIRKDTPFRGRVRVFAKVQNVGDKTFNSGDHEVMLTLTENIPGGGAPRVLRTVRIPQLAPGSAVNVSYYMDWNTSTEFPPSYTAYINHDPDYTLPEVNTSNNQRTRDGAYISSLFH